MKYFVYILTNSRNTVFYTGFTKDIERRVYEHKNNLNIGFTSKYKCYKLVYFEEFSNADEAKHRESQIKRYRRDWKINLVKSINPEWNDLYTIFVTEMPEQVRHK